MRLRARAGYSTHLTKCHQSYRRKCGQEGSEGNRTRRQSERAIASWSAATTAGQRPGKAYRETSEGPREEALAGERSSFQAQASGPRERWFVPGPEIGICVVTQGRCPAAVSRQASPWRTDLVLRENAEQSSDLPRSWRGLAVATGRGDTPRRVRSIGSVAALGSPQSSGELCGRGYASSETAPGA